MSDPTIYAQLADIEKRLKALERQEAGGLAGTWTPGLAGSGGGGVFTLTASGSYVRLGNVVTVSGSIAVATFTSAPAVGDLYITGLPFTVAVSTALSASRYRINVNSGTLDLGLEAVAGNTLIALLENGDNIGTLGVRANLVALTTQITFGGTYICS